MCSTWGREQPPFWRGEGCCAGAGGTTLGPAPRSEGHPEPTPSLASSVHLLALTGSLTNTFAIYYLPLRGKAA